MLFGAQPFVFVRVGVRDYKPPTWFQDARHLVNGTRRIRRVMQHHIRQNHIRFFISKRQ
jgi:hypothetical protein